MAKWQEMDEAEWGAWVASRPPIIQDLASRFRPDTLYRLATTGQRVYPLSFNENGTLTVAITGQFNRILFGRKVFGIDPKDLTECDLPGPNEELGDISAEAGYSRDDVEQILIPLIRKDMGFA